MKREDPFRGFRFLIEIEGLVSAGFTRVKGISRELKYESYREGGVNDYEHSHRTGARNDNRCRGSVLVSERTGRHL